MSNVASSKYPANGKAPEDQQNGVNERPQEANNNVDAQAAQQQQDGDTNASSAEPEGGYPPQIHAGAVGLGPDYGAQQRATAGDKIQGYKEEIAGKITRNHDKVQHGKEMRTGELKKKQHEHDDQANPFGNAADGDKDKKPEEPTGGPNTTNEGREDVQGNAAQNSVTGKRGPQTHPTEAGAQAQAATTAPEGTEQAEKQARGGNVDNDRQIDTKDSNRDAV